MSRWSGKCDIADSFEDRDDEFIANGKFYIHTADGRYHKLDINCWKDLAPYSCHIIAMSSGNKDSATVCLSTTDYITESENESLGYVLEDAIRAYRRVKRKHEPFDVEKVTQEIFYSDKDTVREVVKRVAESGEKANTRGIHFAYKDRQRREFADYLISLGYSQAEAEDWCFGWQYRYRKELENCK